MAGGETVEQCVVIEEAGAGAFLDELVVEIVDAAGVGAEEEAVCDEILSDRGLVDAVVEFGKLGSGGSGLEFLARGSKACSGGGFQWDDDSGEFPVQGDRMAGEADDGIDIAEISTGEAGAIENEGIGRRKPGGDELLFARVGILCEEYGSDLVDFGIADA